MHSPFFQTMVSIPDKYRAKLLYGRRSLSGSFEIQKCGKPGRMLVDFLRGTWYNNKDTCRFPGCPGAMHFATDSLCCQGE